MDVTVVISNFNYSNYVSSAIESCLDQSYPCSIIVVDDASTDNSWDIIRGYVQDGVKAVRLAKNSNGNARGKNIGISLSKTPYITCLDADDMLLPDSIKDRIPFPPDIDFVHGWSIFLKSTDHYAGILSSTNVLSRKFRYNERQKKLQKEEEVRWTWAIEASTVLAHRSLYERFGLYDEEMRWSIDREMWWRWLSHGAKKSVLPKFVSIYRRHEDQLTQDRKRKDPKLCSRMLKDRQSSRKNISKKNTILMDNYNIDKYIEEILSRTPGLKS